VEADATNHHLSCDHMALAESDVDSTEAVIHGVISEANAKMVENYLEANKKSICRINAVRERIVLNVTSPEDIMKNGNFVVDVLVVDQVKKCSDFEDWKGTTHFDPDFIAELKHFGQDDIA
jgi:TRAP-type mannitol/chloroaromatic compound transport system substrate-binding protein